MSDSDALESRAENKPQLNDLNQSAALIPLCDFCDSSVEAEMPTSSILVRKVREDVIGEV
jgi:hypothetical protein